MPTPAVQSAVNTIGNSQPVNNTNRSGKGPLALPLRVDLTSNTSALVDLYSINAFQTLDFVQTLYVDNSGNGSPVSIYDDTSQQNITIPAGAEAYLPFLVPNPSRFIVSSAGGVVVPIQCLNFYVAPCVWGGAAGGTVYPFLFDGAGNLETTDALLRNASLTGSSLNVNVTNPSTGGGTPEFDDFHLYLSGTGSSGTQTILTGTNKYLLHTATFAISPIAFNKSGVAGMNQVRLLNESTPILQLDFWLPAAAPTPTALAAPTEFHFLLDVLGANNTDRLRLSLAADIGSSSQNDGIDVAISALATHP